MTGTKLVLGAAYVLAFVQGACALEHGCPLPETPAHTIAPATSAYVAWTGPPRIPHEIHHENVGVPNVPSGTVTTTYGYSGSGRVGCAFDGIITLAGASTVWKMDESSGMTGSIHQIWKTT